MNKLEIIDERNVLGKEFRIYGTVDEPLFLVRDVAKWLDHNKPSELVSLVDDSEKVKVHTNPGDSVAGVIQANTDYWMLTEYGLYEVLMQSRKPIAKSFKKEVKEILKTIRKHGAYMTDLTIDTLVGDPDLLIRIATQLKEERTEKAELQKQLDESKEWYSIKRVAYITGRDFRDFNWRKLKEESGVVTGEFIKLGYTNVWSCDIEPTSGEYPDHHLQQDVLPLLKEYWDMIIAFPPCTHLSSAGAQYWPQKQLDGRQQQGIDFFMEFVNCNCKKVAIENPVGIMSKLYRKPDQIIHPWMFGDSASKRTCLWLKGLPKLEPTNIVDKGERYYPPNGHGSSPLWYAKASGKNHSKIRSKTFPGIAKAMAEQFTSF